MWVRQWVWHISGQLLLRENKGTMESLVLWGLRLNISRCQGDWGLTLGEEGPAASRRISVLMLAASQGNSGLSCIPHCDLVIIHIVATFYTNRKTHKVVFLISKPYMYNGENWEYYRNV